MPFCPNCGDQNRRHGACRKCDDETNNAGNIDMMEQNIADMFKQSSATNEGVDGSRQLGNITVDELKEILQPIHTKLDALDKVNIRVTCLEKKLATDPNKKLAGAAQEPHAGRRGPIKKLGGP